MITKDVHFCSQLAKTRSRTRNDPCRRLNVVRMCNIEHFRGWKKSHDVLVKAKELTPKQILSVPCTTCGAAIGEACELHTGAPRTEPHRDRKLSATEAVEAKAGIAARAMPRSFA